MIIIIQGILIKMELTKIHEVWSKYIIYLYKCKIQNELNNEIISFRLYKYMPYLTSFKVGDRLRIEFYYYNKIFNVNTIERL